jgi:hypothetical protein
MVDKLGMSKNIRNTTFCLNPANKAENRAIPRDNKRARRPKIGQENDTQDQSKPVPRAGGKILTQRPIHMHTYIRMKKPHLTVVDTVALHSYPQLLHSLLESQNDTIMYVVVTLCRIPGFFARARFSPAHSHCSTFPTRYALITTVTAYPCLFSTMNVACVQVWGCLGTHAPAARMYV